MGKRLKKLSFWMRRRSQLSFIIVGSIVVVMLFVNEETSVKLNMKYDRQISDLKDAIKLNNDSAQYYRKHRMALEQGQADLEYLARERYHMQRPSEDVFIVRE